MWKLGVATLALTVLLGAGLGAAQSAADREQSAKAPPAPSGMAEPRDAGMMPMMDMCRQMMAGPMMGMRGDQKMDPTMMAHMLQMRGEMMKAMGEIMLKHGTMMQGADQPPR
jgi:hypothetical protein